MHAMIRYFAHVVAGVTSPLVTEEHPSAKKMHGLCFIFQATLFLSFQYNVLCGFE